MNSKNNRFNSILLLLLLVPMIIALIYSRQLISNSSSSDDSLISENSDISGSDNRLIDVYISGRRTLENEALVYLDNPGDYVILEFKKPNTNLPYDRPVSFSLNEQSKTEIKVEDAFESDKYVSFKITLKKITTNARVSFYISNINTYFRLNVQSRFETMENGTLPDITFYD